MNKIMNKNISYSQLENEITAKYRHDLSLAESTEDVKKFFTYTVKDLIQQVGEGKVTVDYEDVHFDPDLKEHFCFSDRLLGDVSFSTLLRSSDLHAIVKRLALKAAKTFKHLAKHPEKTEAKMYHV